MFVKDYDVLLWRLVISKEHYLCLMLENQANQVKNKWRRWLTLLRENHWHAIFSCDNILWVRKFQWKFQWFSCFRVTAALSLEAILIDLNNEYKTKISSIILRKTDNNVKFQSVFELLTKFHRRKFINVRKENDETEFDSMFGLSPCIFLSPKMKTLKREKIHQRKLHSLLYVNQMKFII